MMGFDWVLVVGWVGGGLVGRGRFETCPYGLVGGKLGALSEPLITLIFLIGYDVMVLWMVSLR